MKTRSIEILARGVCVKRGRLLLCHTRGADNTYLPGGHVEFGESARLSLAREIREELGATARVGRFLGAAEHVFMQKGEPHAEINLVFAMTVAGVRVDRAPQSCEKHIDFLWSDLATLETSRLEPASLRRMLPVWLDDSASERWANLPNAKKKS